MSVKVLGLILAGGLCLASAAFGQNRLELTPGSTGGPVIANYCGALPAPCTSTDSTDASPYSMSLNGAAAVQMFCDDSADNINFSQEWYVNAGTSLSAIAAGSNLNSVYYDGVTGSNATALHNSDSGFTGTLTQAQEYVAAAWLAANLTEPGGAFFNKNPSDNADVSLAIWDLFVPQNPIGDYLQLDAAAKADLQNAIAYVLSNPNNGGYVNVGGKSYTATIYTPLQDIPGTGYDILGPSLSPPQPEEQVVAGSTQIATPQGLGRPQEFMLLSVPEPSTWAFLGFDFVGAGIAGLYFRRRNSRARS